MSSNLWEPAVPCNGNLWFPRWQPWVPTFGNRQFLAMVTFGSHVGNHQFQPFLSGVYAGVIFWGLCWDRIFGASRGRQRDRNTEMSLWWSASIKILMLSVLWEGKDDKMCKCAVNAGWHTLNKPGGFADALNSGFYTIWLFNIAMENHHFW